MASSRGQEEEHIMQEDEGVHPTYAEDYVQKKTVGKGLLNVSLLMNNAVQLKTLCGLGDDVRGGFWVASLVLVALSIVLQLVVTVLLAQLSLTPIRIATHMRRAAHVNDVNTLLVLAVTVINIFVSSFGLAGGATPTE